MAVSIEARYRGCLIGLACGDAVGTTVEFQPRGTFARVTDMVGGGPFHLEPGQWTDDTSMALCLAESLLECNGFSPRDQMERYCRWWKEGYLSSTGTRFDIGRTVADALSRFRATGEPFSGSRDPLSAGNGSLMRLAPVPMYYALDRAAAVRYAAESSRTTHGCDEAVDACRYFAALLVQALAGAGKDEVLEEDAASFGDRPLAPAIRAIARGDYREKTADDIHGGGYVVHSLEAALWCFRQTQDFEEAILTAVNLGEDADTTAAICGQIAGAFYGVDAIPDGWLGKLVMRERIEVLADRLREARPISQANPL
ncbi:MAG: ADP-ribosylglycohydrolase family protein [Planctomycetota bacterium]